MRRRRSIEEGEDEKGQEKTSEKVSLPLFPSSSEPSLVTMGPNVSDYSFNGTRTSTTTGTMISPEDYEFGVRLCSVFFHAGARVDCSDSLRRRNNNRRVSSIISAKHEYRSMRLVERNRACRKQNYTFFFESRSFSISRKHRLIVFSM